MTSAARLTLDNVSLWLPRDQAEGQTLRGALLGPAFGLFSQQQRDANRIVILDKVSLSAGPGDRIGLLGWNGAGKTSLLKIAAGIYPTSEGAVTSEGRVGTLLSLEAGFDVEATGRENTFLQGLTMGYTMRDLARTVTDIEAFADIGPYFDLPVRTYSSGMRVRLSFAIATAFNPDILIMDEWLSVGDERFAEKAEARLSDVVSRASILLLATHNTHLLERICSRAIVMHQGRVAFDGPPADAIVHYRSI